MLKPILAKAIGLVVLLVLAGPASAQSEAEIRRDYRPLLSDPAKLGYSPGQKDYQDVRLLLKNRYAGAANDAVLFSGILEELTWLLEQAGVGSEGLLGVNPSGNVVRSVAEVYGDRVPPQVLAFGVCQGALRGLADPHCELLSAAEYRLLLKRQSLAGIGLQLDEGARVLHTAPGSPAEAAGLVPGDAVVAVDGEPLPLFPRSLVGLSLWGETDSALRLTVRSGSSNREFEMLRNQGANPTVVGRLLPSGEGYLHLRGFDATTPAQLDQVLSELRRRGAKTLLIDLRNNAGGALNAVVPTLDKLLGSEQTVFSIVDSRNRHWDYRTADPQALSMPAVVLINEATSQAAEVAAAALAQWLPAPLVGTSSRGHTSVQQMFPLGNGSAVRLTVGHLLLASGAPLDESGLFPEEYVRMGPGDIGVEGADQQLQRALEVLHTRGADSP